MEPPKNFLVVTQEKTQTFNGIEIYTTHVDTLKNAETVAIEKDVFKMSAEKTTLEDWSQEWNRKTKADVVFDPDDDILEPGFISLGFPTVDLMFGGGIPRGRSTMFFGEKSTGKTLLSQLAIAKAQKAGGTAVFFDIERTYDPKWFALTGVDTSKKSLRVVRPRNLEQAFDMVCDLLDTISPDIIVMDSIPALVAKAEMEASMETQDFRGLSARKITAGVKRATQYNQNTALIFINQMRTEMGVTFGNPEKLPGGKALKFHMSLMVRTRRGAWLTDADVPEDELPDLDTVLESDKDPRRIGFMLRLRTEYNKLAPPQQSCNLRFTFDGQIDPIGSLVHLAIQRGVIEAARSFYTVPTVDKKLHGLGAVEKLLKGDEELKERIIQLVKEA